MDKLGRQLKDDAERIEAEVSPELEKRIDASLAAAERRPPARPATGRRSRTFHLASALTGAAAAAVLVAVLMRGGEEPAIETTPAATPEYVAELPNPIPLELRQADLTDPLQQELEHLESDARRVRETLERELGVTL